MQLWKICRYQYADTNTNRKQKEVTKKAGREHSLEGYNDSRIIAATDQTNEKKKPRPNHSLKMTITRKQITLPISAPS